MEALSIDVGVSILIILVTLIVAFLANRFILRQIRRVSEDTEHDPTNYKFLRHLVLAAIYLVGFGLAIASIPSLRAVASSMLAGAGILAVAVGFAAQHALGNIISGVFIVLFKPFKINDRLALQNYVGIVEDITLRHTVIRDFENKRIIIPNTVISDEIIVNADFAEERICKWIEIPVSYESDLDLAKSIIAEEILNHPLHIDHRSPDEVAQGSPEAVVRLIALQDSGMLLRGWAWSLDAATSFQMSCDLLESIKKRFDQEGIAIPYPHLKLVK